MTAFSDFQSTIKEWANREDWTDTLVTSFIRAAEAKFNAELRIDKMIQFDEALIASRCAPLPEDWLQMELVRIANGNAPDGFLPIRYKSRDEFFTTVDNWSYGFYTIQGRQIFIGGYPDTVNGQLVKLTYYGEVPVFSDDTPSWINDKYPAMYLYAALMHSSLHAVGEEQSAANYKQLTEEAIQKLNANHAMSRASGSRVTRTRTRSFG